MNELPEVVSATELSNSFLGKLIEVCFVTADHRVIVNEVNTMPGFTPYSMFPVLWESMGLSYAELIADLVDQAASRRLGQR